MLAVSCGARYRPIHSKVVEEANLLKAEVVQNNIQNANTAAADGHLAAAKSKGVTNPWGSVPEAELAAAYYNVALAQYTYDASVVALNEAEAALHISEEQVKKYEQILKEISAGKESN
jgi:hypothetical protein